MSQQLKTQAQAAVTMLEECTLRLLRSHPNGLRTGEVAVMLGIESHVPARNSNWLARTVLEQLVVGGKVVSVKAGNARLFRAASQETHPK